MATATLAIMTAIGASGAGSMAIPALAGVSAAGAIMQGNQEDRAAKAEAKALKVAGDNAFASSQRKAMQARREKRLLKSKAIAQSGGIIEGGSDEALLEGIEEQGAYNEAVAFFEGKSQQSKAYAQAKVRRQEGRNAKSSGYIKAATSFYDIYSKR